MIEIVKLFFWNVYDVRTDKLELCHFITTYKPVLVILCETRGDIRPTISSIFPGAKVNQIEPVTQRHSPARAGLAVITKSGGDLATEEDLFYIKQKERTD